jgi:hypothetical protein
LICFHVERFSYFPDENKFADNKSCEEKSGEKTGQLSGSINIHRGIRDKHNIGGIGGLPQSIRKYIKLNEKLWL